MAAIGTRLTAVLWLVGCTQGGQTGAGDTSDTASTSGDDLREQTTFTHLTTCSGCVDLELWGLSVTETTVVGMYPCFHEGGGALFAEERWDAAIRALEVGSCALMEREVFDVPHLECLDAGTLVYDVAWEGWSVSPLGYQAVVHGYPAAVAFGEAVEHYVAGAGVSFEATGGADIDALQVLGASPDPIALHAPVVDGDVLPPVDWASDLEVEWSGGEGDAVRIWVLGEWREPYTYLELVGCHAPNTGRFVVPAEVLARLDRGQLTHLAVSDRVRHPLPIPEIVGAAWMLGSLASTCVHYDPDAGSPHRSPTRP